MLIVWWKYFGKAGAERGFVPGISVQMIRKMAGHFFQLVLKKNLMAFPFWGKKARAQGVILCDIIAARDLQCSAIRTP